MFKIIKQTVFLLILFTTPSVVLSQEEGEGETIQKRHDFFYNPRAYPYDSIPSDAYINAFQQKNNLNSSQGFYYSSNQWTCLGPTPLAGYWSGRISFVKYDPRNTNRIFLGAADGGIWKSTNGGTTWLPKTDRLPTLSCGAISIDATEGIIYYGSGDATWTSNAYTGDGIYKSNDDGDNWTKINSIGLPRRTNFTKILVSPINNHVLYAALNTGFYRSTNQGVNWTRLIPESGPDRICSDAVISPDGMNIYAIGPGYNYHPDYHTNGIDYWKSSDGGQTFVPMLRANTGFPHFDPAVFPPGRTRITLCKSSPNVLYIVTMNDETSGSNFGPHYVYKSNNYGETFSLINNGLPTTWAGDNSNYDIFIEVSPHDFNLVFEGAVFLFRSTDGSTFQFTGENTHFDHHCLDFNPDPNYQNHLIEGDDGGVFKSTNTGSNLSWGSLNTAPLTLTQMYSINSNHTDNTKLIGGTQDEGMAYSENFPYWYLSSGGDGGSAVFSPINSSNAVCNVCNGIAYYSTNSGVNWSPSNNYFGKWDWLAALAAHPNEAGVFYMLLNSTNTGGPFYLFKSIDNGANWSDGVTPFSTISNSALLNIQPENLAISNSNPNIMYFSAGKRTSIIQMPNPIFKSSDGGVTWGSEPILIGGTKGVPDKFFSHIEVDPGNPNEILLTLSGFGSGHVYRTQDGGDNWENISGTTLPDNPANDIIVHYLDCDTKEYIVATDVGVYRTNANSISWQEIANNLPNSAAVDLDYHAFSGKLRVSTFGRGIWEIALDNPLGNDYPICIKSNTVIPASTNIDHDILVCPGATLTISNPGTELRFASDKKITVMDGGLLNASSSTTPITFTAQTDSWGGIVFEGNQAGGNLTNCIFNSTNTPVTCNYSALHPPIGVTMMGCQFFAPVVINKHMYVTIRSCVWDYTASLISFPYYPVCGIDMIDASQNTIRDNTIIYNINNVNQSFIGISSTYGNLNNIFRNHITNVPVGILSSNGNVTISENWIDYQAGYPSSISTCGVSVDNIYSSSVRFNTITSAKTGINIVNSSPNVLLNISQNDLNDANQNGMVADNMSYPKLKPTYTDQQIIWDGGQNTLKCTINGNGIMVNESMPDIDMGYNDIFGIPYNISGTLPYGESNYNATYNCWDGDPNGKFNILGVTVYFDPIWCGPPPGGAGTSGEGEPKDLPFIGSESTDEPPPPPLIEDLGNGMYETLRVTTGNIQLSGDKTLYFNARKQEIIGNYTNAIGVYSQVVQQYHDSVTAFNALRKIMYCYDRLNSDTSTYSNLRNYYRGLIQNFPGDTNFLNIVSELAAKTYVRCGRYPEAISGYENIIAHTADSSVILCSELNIIEIYMILNRLHNGNAPEYIGSLKYLKPSSIADGHKMIMTRLFKVSFLKDNKIIPNVFKLAQNYPNPFNPITTISYSLPHDTKVNIKIYDLLGRLVKELVNEYKTAGIYNVKFDGTNFASGVYFYRIEAGTFVDTKKMVLVK